MVKIWQYNSATLIAYIVVDKCPLATDEILTALTAGVQEHMHKYLGWPGSQALMEKYNHATFATHGIVQYMLHLVQHCIIC
jgi:hypothetical protein